MGKARSVSVGPLQIGNDLPFTLLAGPCAIESREHALTMAAGLKEICAKLGIGLIYKSSFDKANRTSASAKRGVGFAAGLDILAEVKSTHGLAVVTDIHGADQCAPVAEVADILQIPALSVPPNRSADRRRGNRRGGECEKGAVSGPVGYGECGGKNSFHRQ